MLCSSNMDYGRKNLICFNLPRVPSPTFKLANEYWKNIQNPFIKPIKAKLLKVTLNFKKKIIYQGEDGVGDGDVASVDGERVDGERVDETGNIFGEIFFEIFSLTRHSPRWHH